MTFRLTLGEDAVERLAFIGGAKQLGLPLEEIAALLAVWAAARAPGRPGGRDRGARRRRAGVLPFFDFRIHLDHLVLRLEITTSTDGTGMLADLFGTAS